MVTRLIARTGLLYPADAESLALVRQAGGFTQLSDEDSARVLVKSVEAGDFCDDLPNESRALLLERGQVELVEISE